MVEVLITVVELKVFEAAAADAGVTEVERKEITDFVARNPECGAIYFRNRWVAQAAVGTARDRQARRISSYILLLQ